MVFEAAGASPTLIDRLEQKQIVLSTQEGLRGIDLFSGEELWRDSREGGIPTPVWNGEDLLLYGCSSDEILCVDMTTGECLWREEGWPSLVAALPQGFEAHARFQVAEHQAYTAPAMLGNTLFVRDRKSIQALDLGPQRG